MNYNQTLETNLEFLKSQQIAIVGNAEMTTEYGLLLDSHDEIIRINNYVIDHSFIKYTGQKTTIWCNHGQKGIEYRPHEMAICPFKRKFKFEHCPLITPIKNWHKETKLKRITTGGLLLYIFHRLGIKANLFGFDFLKTGQYWNHEHQHSNFYKPDKERKLIESSVYLNYYDTMED